MALRVDRIAADLAAKNLESEIAARQQASALIIAEQGRWYTAIIRALLALNPPGNVSFNEEALKLDKTALAAEWIEQERGLFPKRPMTNRLPLKPATLNKDPTSGWRD